MLVTSMICFAFLLGACSKTTTEQPIQEEEKNPPKQEEAPNAEQESFPLTGVKTSESVEGRAIAVMVNNHPDARPQSGLAEADIVYELLAEGNVTRFLAIYQSEWPEIIGPVRSARDYYINLALGYDSLFLAHGYSPDAQEMLLSGVIDQINGMQYDGTLFKRADFRKAPHNSYISAESIQEGAEKLGYDLIRTPDGLSFSDEAPTGEQADYVKVAYDGGGPFTAEYMYDEAEQTYARYSAGEQTKNLETEAPIALSNILIFETVHRVIDDAGRKAIDLTSGGRAYVVQKGVYQEIEWKNQDGRLLPFADGTLVQLTPGKTWIHIVPDMNIVSFEK
ncbi:DUF3048 domain-containing protein [Bacillus sp. FJAT-50079]|nr:DUF3048 domain-containing protein [Bacillus sp. FJAT-50079]MBS4209579.1 DUF3048 domain-containing protein [Bacillus sp. FJAT-50079]